MEKTYCYASAAEYSCDDSKDKTKTFIGLSKVLLNGEKKIYFWTKPEASTNPARIQRSSNNANPHSSQIKTSSSGQLSPTHIHANSLDDLLSSTPHSLLTLFCGGKAQNGKYFCC